jgi:dTDP-4-amino-4,6-dideoxy-D-galactose acyltransferase
MNLIDWNPIGFLERFYKVDSSPWKNEISKFESKEYHDLFLKRLDWDSSFFNSEIVKILFINGEFELNRGFEFFSENNISKRPVHFFLEIPSEATHLFKSLMHWGFSLVETRLTYFHKLNEIPDLVRQSRVASEIDIPFLKKVASEAINEFDRYHADDFFSGLDTDRYLQTYIENCVKGFAERVFVPDLDSNPASFVALSRLQELGWLEKGPLFRIPLTACLPKNKGWHYHLCVQALHYAKANQSKCLVMTTQSTNKAVIHNCEKMGFKLGSSFHIFSKSFY